MASWTTRPYKIQLTILLNHVLIFLSLDYEVENLSVYNSMSCANYAAIIHYFISKGIAIGICQKSIYVDSC